MLQRALVSHLHPEREREFPPDIIRLLDIFARIERRRQARLQEIRAGEKHSPPG